MSKFDKKETEFRQVRRIARLPFFAFTVVSAVILQAGCATPLGSNPHKKVTRIISTNILEKSLAEVRINAEVAAPVKYEPAMLAVSPVAVYNVTQDSTKETTTTVMAKYAAYNGGAKIAEVFICWIAMPIDLIALLIGSDLDASKFAEKKPAFPVRFMTRPLTASLNPFINNYAFLDYKDIYYRIETASVARSRSPAEQVSVSEPLGGLRITVSSPGLGNVELSGVTKDDGTLAFDLSNWRGAVGSRDQLALQLETEKFGGMWSGIKGRAEKIIPGSLIIEARASAGRLPELPAQIKGQASEEYYRRVFAWNLMIYNYIEHLLTRKTRDEDVGRWIGRIRDGLADARRCLDKRGLVREGLDDAIREIAKLSSKMEGMMISAGSPAIKDEYRSRLEYLQKMKVSFEYLKESGDTLAAAVRGLDEERVDWQGSLDMLSSVSGREDADKKLAAVIEEARVQWREKLLECDRLAGLLP